MPTSKPVPPFRSASGCLDPPAQPDCTLNAEVDRICKVEGGYPSSWPRHDRCPCCGERDLRYLFQKYEFTHEQCLRCEFVFLNPFPPEQVLARLYAGNYYTRCRELFEYARIAGGAGGTPYTAPTELIEMMIARCGQGAVGVWLDVGGGLGSTAHLIKKRKPQWSVVLNDFNPRSLELAEELFGLQTTAASAQALADQGAIFDVISCVSVLEHIADPVPFIASYAKLLRPGGTMAVLVPQFTFLNAAVSRGSAPVAAPPFHLSLFRESNIQMAFARAGCFGSIQSIQHGPAAFSLLHHYQYGDNWDITIPTEDQPEPRSFLIKPHPIDVQRGLNALAEAQSVVADHFAEVDGKQYIAVFAQTPV